MPTLLLTGAQRQMFKLISVQNLEEEAFTNAGRVTDLVSMLLEVIVATDVVQENRMTRCFT